MLKIGAVLMLSVILLGNDGCKKNQAQEQLSEKIATNETIMENQPGAQLKFSMDRYLLNQRNVRFNDPSKMNYLYVVAPDGTWLQVTIIGKLTSTSKRLTATKDGVGNEIADEMATYGSSDPSKVGITTLGSMLEFGGFMGFIYSEVPLIFKNMTKPIVEVTVQVTDAERQALRKQIDALRKEALKK